MLKQRYFLNVIKYLGNELPISALQTALRSERSSLARYEQMASNIIDDCGYVAPRENAGISAYCPDSAPLNVR
jgi:hypothetical protein